MMQIVIINRDGKEQPIEALDTMTLMEAIRDAGHDELLALCGGCCSCATCHVHIDAEVAGVLSPMTDDENDLLDGSRHRDERSRLSCQVRLASELSGMRVFIAQED